MPHDLPSLVQALTRGVIFGAVGATLVLLWRLYRRKPLLPKRTNFAEVPFFTWVLGAGIFTLAAIGSAAANLPSFTVFLGVVALLYLAAMIYGLR